MGVLRFQNVVAALVVTVVVVSIVAKLETAPSLGGSFGAGNVKLLDFESYPARLDASYLHNFAVVAGKPVAFHWQHSL